MTKEQVYRQQMTEAGTWEDIYVPALHELCMMEREETRILKEWKKKYNSDPNAPIVPVLFSLRRDILAYRNSMGLTPAAMKKIKNRKADAGVSASKRLDDVLTRLAGGDASD